MKGERSKLALKIHSVYLLNKRTLILIMDKMRCSILCKGSSGRTCNTHLCLSKIGRPTYVKCKVDRQTCKIHIYSEVCYTHTAGVWPHMSLPASHSSFPPAAFFTYSLSF